MKQILKYAFGVCSNCEDGKHIIMLDFDNVYLDNVYKTIKSIQKKYFLSHFYLVESNNGYNAFCLNKRDFEDIIKMLKYRKYIDKNFVKLAKKLRGFFVLRMGDDKKLIDIIKNEHISLCYEKLSNAHRNFFRDVMDFPIDNNLIYDEYYKFKPIAFKSGKHGIVDLND